jgi:hypothetical protein
MIPWIALLLTDGLIGYIGSVLIAAWYVLVVRFFRVAIKTPIDAYVSIKRTAKLTVKGDLDDVWQFCLAALTGIGARLLGSQQVGSISNGEAREACAVVGVYIPHTLVPEWVTVRLRSENQKTHRLTVECTTIGDAIAPSERRHNRIVNKFVETWARQFPSRGN